MESRLFYPDMNLIFLLFVIPVTCLCNTNRQWPVPPQKYQQRPTSDSYCQAGVIPFCSTGLPANHMPKFGPKDTLYVYAMKAPVYDLTFGSFREKFNIMRDAIGFHHVQSGLNLTMEWYELFQLSNCTFPHEVNETDEPQLLWCNQGATCASAGIDENHWRQNGTLVKVSEISGEIFNQFADWVEKDNTTYPFYETWTVLDKQDGNPWFNPVDSASWILRAFDEIKNLGGTFDHNVHLNYTKINLFSKMPMKLGNFSQIFNTPSMSKTKNDLLKFYEHFQKETNFIKLIQHLLEALAGILIEDSFFLYYNDIYWRLPLTAPFIKLTNEEVPLP